MSCPNSEAWLCYLRGESAENQVSSLEDHLATCPQCQAAIEQLAEQSDSVLRLVAEAAIGGRATELEQGGAGAKHVREQSFVRETDPLPFVIHEAAMIRDYRIMERIGQGGMGCVYRALHVRLNKQVALKILKSERSDSPEAVSRFAREMRLLAKLEHPCIVKALDAGEHEGKPYFVMEFVAGIDLGQLVRRLGPLPIPDACQAVRLAASALQFAHDQKVIHRDVKPSNVMIAADGSVKLLDLGLAQIFDLTLEDNISRMDQAVGTFAYMAPEQMTGSQQVTRQSDIFSLGVTLHELLTGQRPFAQRGLPPLISDIQAVRPDVDVALASLIKEMIALKPTERPLTMTEVVMRLSSIAPTTDLSAIVAEYYRWNNRSFTGAISDAVRADTVVDCATTSKMAQSKSSTVKAGQVTHKPRWLNPLIGASLVLAASTLLAITVGAGWMPWKEPKPPVAESTPAITKGKIDISWSADSKVVSQLIVEKKVKLRNIDTDESHEVQEGAIELLPGKYELNLNASVDLRMDGSIVEVTANKTTYLELEALLKTAFQYPDIPSKPEAYGSYSVSLWRMGWENRDRVAFDLTLEILDVDFGPSNAPKWKWLKIELHNDGDKERYEETAYLKIDAERWEKSQKLVVYEGWVVATSPKIADFMKAYSANEGTQSVIVRFDPVRDLLSEIDSIPLPKKRLSAHDLILLFFGEESVSAAAEPIRALRSKLIEMGRNDWLEKINTSFGLETCYVVSSRKQEDDVSTPFFLMARRRSDDHNPFGFIKLEVDSPLVWATCLMNKAGQTEVDPNWGMREPNELRKQEFKPKQFPPPSEPPIRAAESTQAAATPSGTRFDLATIPKQPGSVRYLGTITRGSSIETLDVTARMLGTETFKGRRYHWVEVEVTSTIDGRDAFQAARMLINADEYENNHKFLIKRGWIAYGNKETLFQIPTDGDLEKLVDYRLTLQQACAVDRTGIIDVVSMLFDGNLEPGTTISDLRALITGSLPNATRSSREETITLTSGTFSCEHWTPGENLRTDILALSVPKYDFFRCPDVPFGFVRVTLNVPTRKLTINLDLNSQQKSLPDDFSESYFGSEAELNKLLAKCGARFYLQRQSKPNWRVWTWKDQGKTYKAWAEFGGTLDWQGIEYVLLRDKLKQEITVRRGMLSDEDEKSILAGRYWETFAENPKRVLIKDDKAARGLTFFIPGRNETKTHQGEPTAESDKKWLEKLRNAISAIRYNNLKEYQDWQDFAQYVR